MGAEEIAEVARDMRHQVIEDMVDTYMPPKILCRSMGYRGPDRGGEGNARPRPAHREWAEEDGVDQEVVRERLETKADEYMASKAAQFGPEQMRNIEKQILLQTIDQKWREHLLTLEHLRSVVGFRGYAQRDPLNEYKTESFQLFERMLDSLRTDVSSKLARIQPLTPEQQAEIIRQLQAQQAAQEQQLETADISAGGAARPPPMRPRRWSMGSTKPIRDTWGNPGRNDPAPADRARSSSIATAGLPDGKSS
jgi:preprotein translocase subunit SecA